MKEIIHIKHISEVHDLLGIDKPRHPLVTVLPINEKLVNYDFGDYTYVFDFYQVSLKAGLSGSFSYGANSYDFREGMMIFMKPNQTVKMNRQDEIKGNKGWTLLFHPDLLRKSDLGISIEEFSFFNYDVKEALFLSDQEKRTLTDLVEKIESEYSQHIDKHSQELIITNIELLLKYCRRYFDRQFYTRTNYNKDVITQFEQLIREYYAANKPAEHGVLTVSYCAEKLNMSSNYLGDLLRNETGKSAKEHLQDYLIDKAKTHIIGSNDPISDIAFRLGFEYPQSFNKLFKAKTGLSPREYRNTAA